MVDLDDNECCKDVAAAGRTKASVAQGKVAAPKTMATNGNRDTSRILPFRFWLGRVERFCEEETDRLVR